MNYKKWVLQGVLQPEIHTTEGLQQMGKSTQNKAEIQKNGLYIPAHLINWYEQEGCKQHLSQEQIITQAVEKMQNIYTRGNT